MTGEEDCVVTISQLETVQISTRIEMDIDQFYATNGPMLFIDKMAAFLGIPNDKLRIVSIIEGSTIIDYEVVIDEITKNSTIIAKIISDHMLVKPNSNSTEVENGTCTGVSNFIA